MTLSEIRAEAGKWRKAALFTLVIVIITYFFRFICVKLGSIGTIANLVISPILSFISLIGFIKLKRNEEINYIDLFKNGFNQFGKVWAVIGNTLLKMIIPIVILIVSIIVLVIEVAMSTAKGSVILAVIGFIAYFAALIYVIVKGLSYSLVQYILYDNPDMEAKAIVEKSAELMNGHKWQYFWLPVTFFGWMILAGLSLGIGMLWLLPYIKIAIVIFYVELADRIVSTPIAKEKTDEDNGPISE